MSHAAVYSIDAPQGVNDVTTPRPPRATDARSLTLPISAVIVIVIAVAGYAIQQTLAMASLRSEVREIRLLIDSQRENVDLKMTIMRLEMEKGELRKALLSDLKPDPKK